MSDGTEKQIIRKWRMEDAADLAVALNNQHILDNLRDGIPFPYTISDAEDYIEKMISANENEIIARAILADDKVIGSISVNRRDNIYVRTAEIGYYIAEPYWGRGIVTEAVRQICHYAFENTDLVRIDAAPFAFNRGSCRVLEKAGFQYEGTLRCNAVKNGRIYDMKMYALIKECSRE